MRYATPTRSALLVRQPGPIGQHRYPVPHRHARRNPQQTAHLLTRGLAALIVSGIVVMLAVLIVADEGHPPVAAASEADSRIASRAVDPEPLSETEVFPAGSATFRTARTTLTADCALAASGTLRSTLRRYGCTQAVRAALTVPHAAYRVTAGVLNLPDTASAEAVGRLVPTLVESGDGGFTDLAGAETAPGTPVGWRTRGHYLMYCAITGPDGELLPGDDPQVQRITSDLLDAHLSETVLSRRAV
ncbi:hypothetical protein AB0M02_07875 [Actinoplanes sp. NPDC051861]|uniref:hypothetical protein n=1 Tax=Actinoplanes sp. NPDC051861 TaxID=3155170 RepID=UPI003443A7E0